MVRKEVRKEVRFWEITAKTSASLMRQHCRCKPPTSTGLNPVLFFQILAVVVHEEVRKFWEAHDTANLRCVALVSGFLRNAN